MTFSPRNYCSDCNVDVHGISEYNYMLKSEIWLKVAKSSEFLCIGCLERRLSRKIDKNDFNTHPINWEPFKRVRKSARLLNRLQRG